MSGKALLLSLQKFHNIQHSLALVGSEQTPLVQHIFFFFSYGEEDVCVIKKICQGNTEGLTQDFQFINRGHKIFAVPGRDGGLRNSGQFCKAIGGPAPFLAKGGYFFQYVEQCGISFFKQAVYGCMKSSSNTLSHRREWRLKLLTLTSSYITLMIFRQTALQ